MLIVAKLTGNRRDVNTASPKALLIDIEGFDRDHCWVEITPELDKIQPLGHQRPVKVAIWAKQKKYVKQGKEQRQTLIIKEIRRIK
jgi:hypothetical protein